MPSYLHGRYVPMNARFGPRDFDKEFETDLLREETVLLSDSASVVNGTSMKEEEVSDRESLALLSAAKSAWRLPVQSSTPSKESVGPTINHGPLALRTQHSTATALESALSPAQETMDEQKQDSTKLKPRQEKRLSSSGLQSIISKSTPTQVLITTKTIVSRISSQAPLESLQSHPITRAPESDQQSNPIGSSTKHAEFDRTSALVPPGIARLSSFRSDNLSVNRARYKFEIVLGALSRWLKSLHRKYGSRSEEFNLKLSSPRRRTVFAIYVNFLHNFAQFLEYDMVEKDWTVGFPWKFHEVKESLSLIASLFEALESLGKGIEGSRFASGLSAELVRIEQVFKHFIDGKPTVKRTNNIITKGQVAIEMSDKHKRLAQNTATRVEKATKRAMLERSNKLLQQCGHQQSVNEAARTTEAGDTFAFKTVPWAPRPQPAASELNSVGLVNGLVQEGASAGRSIETESQRPDSPDPIGLDCTSALEVSVDRKKHDTSVNDSRTQMKNDARLEVTVQGNKADDVQCSADMNITTPEPQHRLAEGSSTDAQDTDDPQEDLEIVLAKGRPGCVFDSAKETKFDSGAVCDSDSDSDDDGGVSLDEK